MPIYIYIWTSKSFKKKKLFLQGNARLEKGWIKHCWGTIRSSCLIVWEFVSRKKVFEMELHQL